MTHQRFIGTFVLVLFSLFANHAAGEDYRIVSPDQAVAVDLSVDDSGLAYTLSWRGQAVFNDSAISLFPDARYEVMAAEQTPIDHTWQPVWGQFSEIRDHCQQLTLKLLIDETQTHLLIRVYNHAVGFRFVLPQQQSTQGLPLTFYCEFNTPQDLAGYFPNGEREPLGPERLSEWLAQAHRPQPDANAKPQAPDRAMPGVFEQEDGTYLALLESDLYSARAFTASRLSANPTRRGATINARAVADGEETVTPWRIVLLGESPGDLIENQTALNLAAPCAIQDPSWIKPGKGLWDWRIHGYDNGEFVYDIDTRSYLRLIDFAAGHNIDYLTIDDHWFTRADNGVMDIAPQVDIERVMRHAKEKGVGVVLYYDRKKGEYGDEGLYKFYQRLGAAGMKYGFMGNAAAFTRGSIEAAAEAGLLIFYHDNPVPMTGVHRTLPNMVTREYCHAQQDSRRAFTPESFLKMAMINALSGPLDQANGNFGIQSINAGERKKGPRKQNSYVSTVVSEVARTLVIYSGLVTLPDAPEEYLKKADLFGFLEQMPATWDQTRVLSCRMGEHISTARRSGDTWFVGSVNNQTPRELTIHLDFLEPGVAYTATLYQDAEDSHGVNNPEAYHIQTATVTSDDSINARMAMGGGHAMIIRPAE